jgi:hydrogenase maturation protease
MGDDAAGPYAVKLIEARYDLPPGASLVEAGTPGLELADCLARFDSVIVIDAVRAQGTPGEIKIYNHAALTDLPGSPALGPHEPGLVEALLTLELDGTGPREVLLVGIIPERIDAGTSLSPAVRASLERVIEIVTAELARRSLPLTAKSAPAAPDLWWERPAS